MLLCSWREHRTEGLSDLSETAQQRWAGARPPPAGALPAAWASCCWAPGTQAHVCQQPAHDPPVRGPFRDAAAGGEGGSLGLESAPTGPVGPRGAAPGSGPLGTALGRGEGAGQRCLAVGDGGEIAPPTGKFLTFFLWVSKLMSKCGGRTL